MSSKADAGQKTDKKRLAGLWVAEQLHSSEEGQLVVGLFLAQRLMSRWQALCDCCLWWPVSGVLAENLFDLGYWARSL